MKHTKSKTYDLAVCNVLSYKIYARKRDNFEVQRALPRIKNVGEMSNFISLYYHLGLIKTYLMIITICFLPPLLLPQKWGEE